MKKIYKSIKKMQEMQEAEAGPLFAELSTPEVWTELIRWMVRQEEEDFVAQMTEVAAMAVWAIQAHQESENLDFVLENALAVGASPDILSSGTPFDARFGPIDRFVPFNRPHRTSAHPAPRDSGHSGNLSDGPPSL